MKNALVPRLRTVLRSPSTIIMLAMVGMLGTSTSGCGSVNEWVERPTEQAMTQERVRSRLIELGEHLSFGIREYADQMVVAEPDVETRKAALKTKTKLIPLIRTIVSQSDPRSALLDLWVLGLQIQGALEDEMNGRSSSEELELYLRSVSSFNGDVEAIAESLLGNSSFEQAREEVQAFVQAHMIEGSSVGRWDLPSNRSWGSLDAFGWVSKIPIIGAFDGLDEGAQAIREFASVAEQFTRLAASLPEEMRWQSELFLYEVEEQATLKTSRKAMASISGDSSRLVDVAERLPDDLRKIFAESFDRLEEQQAGLNAVVEGTRLALADFEGMLTRKEPIFDSLERTAASIATGSLALEEMAHVFMDKPEGAITEAPADPESPGEEKGFDIDAYGVSADSIAVAARELTELVVEFRELSGSPELQSVLRDIDESTRGAVAHAGIQAEALVDLITWRLYILLGSVVAATLFYRLAQRRLSPVAGETKA